MFEVLDRQSSLTGNQKKILGAAIIGDALEFFDFFLIAFVLPFLIGPWKLTFGVSAVVLLSSGVGAILGAITGTVAASVIAMGVISLPVMMRYGYDMKTATGVIAASGTITQLVPPSLVLVVLAGTGVLNENPSPLYFIGIPQFLRAIPNFIWSCLPPRY